MGDVYGRNSVRWPYNTPPTLDHDVDGLKRSTENDKKKRKRKIKNFVKFEQKFETRIEQLRVYADDTFVGLS